METPLQNELIAAFETAIRSLVRRFRNHPYVFYTETDMHGYLYHRLYKPPFNVLYRTSDGHDTILLHEEFPTVSKYTRDTDGHLRNDPASRHRGRLDISIWDPTLINVRTHRLQKVLCAAELALDDCGEESVHTVNDTTKLADPANEIKRGYLLYFVRDKLKDYNQNKIKIHKELNDATAKKIRVVIASKSEMEYWGAWGDFSNVIEQQR
jgi:hypothetical protein